MVRMRAEIVDSVVKARKQFADNRTVFCVYKVQKIQNPAACEMRSVIRFLNAKNMKPPEIHRQLCDVYGENGMSSSMVRRWPRLLNL